MCQHILTTTGRWQPLGGEVIAFERDVRVCNRMPYIDLCEHAEGLVMLETVEKNMEMFTKKEIEKAQLARVVQRRCAHPTDEHMKEIVSQQSLKNIPIRTSDIANTKALFGTSVSGLKYVGGTRIHKPLSAYTSCWVQTSYVNTRFNRGMVLGFFEAHLFFEDEDVVSARRKWLISPSFCRAPASSTHQKVNQMHDKIYPHKYGFMVIILQSPSKLPANSHQRRHNNNNGHTREDLRL